MNKSIPHLLRAAVAGLCLSTLAPSWAQEAGAPLKDPPRWYVDDTSAQAQLRTLRKEIGAALREAQAECKRQPAAARNACMKEARATYRDDLANAEQLRTGAPR